MRLAGLAILICVLSSKALCQKIEVTGKAYRNPVDFALDSPMAESTFLFIKTENSSLAEGYRPQDQGNILTGEDLEFSVWIIADENHLYFNTTRHGFKNRYLQLRKNGLLYFFSAQPILSDHQRNRVFDSYSHDLFWGGWLGVMITYREMTYFNKSLRDNVLNLENGTTTPISAEYIYSLVSKYPLLKNEFVNDTTELNLKRLLYYLDKTNEEWMSAQQNSKNL